MFSHTDLLRVGCGRLTGLRAHSWVSRGQGTAWSGLNMAEESLVLSSLFSFGTDGPAQVYSSPHKEKRSKREQDISEGSGVQLRVAPLPFSLHLMGRASHTFKPKVKRTGEHARAGEELGTTAQPLIDQP